MIGKATYYTKGNRYYNYYSDREEYYINLLYPKSLKDLLFLMENRHNHSFNTENRICFKNIPFGISQKECEKNLGKPRFEVETFYELANHKCVFFKEKIGDMKAVAQLHFLDDKLFLASYIFRSISAEQANNLSTNLQYKYLDSLTGVPFNAIETATISDKENNKIEVQNAIFFIITYISGDRHILYEIKRQVAVKAQNEFEQKQQKNKQIYDSI